jgi:tetratricopeptide (TPR) repeat protein
MLGQIQAPHTAGFVAIESHVRFSETTGDSTVTSLRTDDLAKVMMTAKPSEIRAAARAVRAAVKAERERQEQMLQAEQGAQMKMNKIRAEIEAIKESERERQIECSVAEIPIALIQSRVDPAKGAVESSSRAFEEFPLDHIEDGPHQASNIEELLACMGDEEISDEADLKEMGKRLLEEMEKSFAQLSNNSDHSEGKNLKRSYYHDDLPVSTNTMAFGNEPPRLRMLRSTNDGLQEKDPTARPPQRQRSGLSSRRPPRTSSNLVPEMRRRASQHDLMFDDEVLQPAPTLSSMSSHSPVTGIGLPASTSSAEAKKLKPSSPNCLNGKSAHDVFAIQKSLVPEGKTTLGVDQDKKVAVSSLLSPMVPVPPLNAHFSFEQCGATSPRPSVFRNSAAPITPIRDPNRLKIMEEEKRKLEAQRKKLEEAREYFQEGHDLCWKFQDSARALGEYRKALFIRESLLGKYHDETGRSYYWIGRSLVRLKEYDEALVAFSRALRIFERVLAKNHKYRKWADVAIAAVFREMDDPDADFEFYKKSLDDSIAHERAGDSYRKSKAFALAISEYRAAIENIEEYHPGTSEHTLCTLHLCL